MVEKIKGFKWNPPKTKEFPFHLLQISIGSKGSTVLTTGSILIHLIGGQFS